MGNLTKKNHHGWKEKAYVGTVVLPDRISPRGAVVVDGHRIQSVIDLDKDVIDGRLEILDFGDNYIVPGFIDLHVHGALGKDIMDADGESLKIITSYQARCGVTGFCGATMSSSGDSIFAAVKTAAESAELSLDSDILGAYIEGPFFNPNRKGAHDPERIGSMNKEEMYCLLEAAKSLKVIIPLAPEIPRYMRMISELRNRGVIVAIGHSEATYSQACESFQAGISHVTHLFNAMTDFHHREPGIVGAVLDTEQVTAEIIADGVHVHPSSVRVAVARKGVDRICLVTDSVSAAGLGDGLFTAGSSQVFVAGKKAVLKDTQTLAGSVVTMNQAITNVLGWSGLSLLQVIKMATLNPSRILGLDSLVGSLEEGKQANLVILDKKFNIVRTVLRGEEVYNRNDAGPLG